MKRILNFVGFGLVVGMLVGCGGADGAGAESAGDDSVGAAQQALTEVSWSAKGTAGPMTTDSGQTVCAQYGTATGGSPFLVPGKLWAGQRCSSQYGGGNPGVISSESYFVLKDNGYHWQPSNGMWPTDAVHGDRNTWVNSQDQSPVLICEAYHGYEWTAGKLWRLNGQPICSYEWGGQKQSASANGSNVKILCPSTWCSGLLHQ